jgi:hypothetical protein
MFWGVLDRFVTASNSMQNWPNWCHYHTSSLNKVTSEFFATNAPDPLRWTQKSCFGVVWTVSLLHESRSKTGQAWCHYRRSSLNKVASEFFATNAPDPLHLTQNSCFGAFRTVLLLQLMFWGCFGPFHFCTKVVAKLAELVQLMHKFVKQSCVRFFATNTPDPLHWTQKSCFGVFWTVSLLHESRCKTGRTGAIIAQFC